MPPGRMDGSPIVTSEANVGPLQGYGCGIASPLDPRMYIHWPGRTPGYTQEMASQFIADAPVMTALGSLRVYSHTCGCSYRLVRRSQSAICPVPTPGSGRM